MMMMDNDLLSVSTFIAAGGDQAYGDQQSQERKHQPCRPSNDHFGILPVLGVKLSAEHNSLPSKQTPRNNQPPAGCGAVKQNEALDANPPHARRHCERHITKFGLSDALAG
jgi:hypothetical protein